MLTLFDKLDDAVLAGVNTGVRAWNWTTGKTKVDLANTLLQGAVVVENLGLLYEAYKFPHFLPCAVLAGAVSFLRIHACQSQNREIGDLEERTIHDRLHHPVVEQYKRECPFIGYGMNVLGVGLTSIVPFQFHPVVFGSFATGYSLHGVALHTMRADYLPPRKNCLARGLAYLSRTLPHCEVYPTPVAT